jgi:hypothetical protein
LFAVRPTGDTATPLTAALSRCRSEFFTVGLFSGVVNALQLTVSLYMMQVFDRVLAARSLDTLLYLTLITIAALALLGMLEAARSLVMQRLGQWMERRVAPEGFSRALEAQLRGRPYRMEALRDLAVLRGFLGSPGALALYDLPWVPVFLGVIFLRAGGRGLPGGQRRGGVRSRSDKRRGDGAGVRRHRDRAARPVHAGVHATGGTGRGLVRLVTRCEAGSTGRRHQSAHILRGP